MAINFPQQDGVPVDLLAHSEKMYLEAAEGLALAVENARSEPAGEGKAVIQALRDLKAAFQTAMDERTRIEKLRKQTTGVIGGQSLDLDAARDEIGRRLACLRDAGGSR